MYLMLVWRKLNGTQFEIKPVQTKSKVFNAEHYGPHIRRIHIAGIFVTVCRGGWPVVHHQPLCSVYITHDTDTYRTSSKRPEM